jgi:hypothetical protein
MNEQNLRRLNTAMRMIFRNGPYEVLQVGYGCKNKSGQYTEEKCIRFGVKTKIPLDQIPEEKRIPPTIKFEGIEYKTDVYVAPEKLYTAVAMRKIGEENINTSAGMQIMAVSLCNNIGSSGIPATAPSPVGNNRAKNRPMVGGISMASSPQPGFVNAGTMGIIVKDKFDNKMVALTNNHVCGALPIASSPCYFYSRDYLHPPDFYQRDTINMYQPSSWDSGIVNNPSDFVGITKRCFPLTSTGTNYIDAGIVNISSSMVNTNSWNVMSASFGSAPIFATTEEIDALTTTVPIFISGRTTGPKGPDYYSGCVIQVANTSTTARIGGYGSDPYDPSTEFTDCILLTSTSTVAGLGGDSGSGVYAKIGGIWKVIGLYFAGNEDGSVGFACRIDNVAKLLHIEPYLGESVDANPTSKTYLTLDSLQYGYQASASYGGKTYWQVGIINPSPSPTPTNTVTPTITSTSTTPTPTPTITSTSTTPTPTPTITLSPSVTPTITTTPPIVPVYTLTINIGTNGQSISVNGVTYNTQHILELNSFPTGLIDIDCTPASGYVFSAWQVVLGSVIFDDIFSKSTQCVITSAGNSIITPVFVAA